MKKLTHNGPKGIRGILNAFLGIYTKDISEDVLMAYEICLQDYSREEVYDALKAWEVDKDAIPYQPKPSDIIKKIREKKELKKYFRKNCDGCGVEFLTIHQKLDICNECIDVIEGYRHDIKMRDVARDNGQTWPVRTLPVTLNRYMTG